MKTQIIKGKFSKDYFKFEGANLSHLFNYPIDMFTTVGVKDSDCWSWLLEIMNQKPNRKTFYYKSTLFILDNSLDNGLECYKDLN